MTVTYSWIGATGADWFTPANWSPAGPPTAGSTAVVGPGGGPLVGPGDPTVDDVFLNLSAQGAEVAAETATFGAGFVLTDSAPNAGTSLRIGESSTFGGQAGFAPGARASYLNLDVAAGQTLTIAPTGTLTATLGNGIIFQADNAAVVNEGTLNAAGGLISVYQGTLEGTGTILVGQGGLFYSNTDVGAGQSIGFVDANGSVDFNNATYAGTIGNLQAGDEIIVGGVTGDAVSYDSGTDVLALTSAGTTVATFSVLTSGTVTFGTQLDAYGDTIITSSQATRVWQSATGDWYDPANWLSTPAGAPPGYPVSGDTVQITGATASISAADVAKYGGIDTEDISLQGTSAAPGVLQVDGGTFGVNAAITTAGDAQFGRIVVRDTVVSNGTIIAATRNGRITIDLAGSGATLDNTTSGSILSTNFASLSFEGTGTVINDGIVVDQGGLYIGPNVTFGNSSGDTGIIRLQQGGRATIDGTIGAGEEVEFGDTTGYLRLTNLAGFSGFIDHISHGNRIDIANVQVSAVTYDKLTDALSLYDSGGGLIDTLYVNTVDGYSGFNVQPDNDGGSLITYTPTVQIAQPALPVPLVAAVGSQVSLGSLLAQAFGTVPAQYTQFGLSYLNKADMHDYNWSYWNLSDSQVSPWFVNGTIVPGLPTYPYLPPNPPTTVVNAADVGSVTLQMGNNIGPDTYLTIPIGGTPANPTSVLTYYIQPIDPAVLSPTAYSGIVNPSDIVASAERLAAYYTGIPNDNDCCFIGDAVAAAAGASMPSEDISTDPSANVSGGFWRVVYRGSDYTNPVQNWSTLVQPGDIVRMAWTGGNNGQHTTTVVAKNPDGSLLVFDNAAPTISLHDATYWTETIPSAITIYRLDSNHQYLITGSSAAEFLQGSVYNNLIQPGGGADTITAGAGQNEIQDTATHLNDVTITDFHSGDWIDITDMPVGGVTYSYDSGSGVLDLDNIITGQSVALNLPSALPGAFSLTADPTGHGTQVTLPCFVAGTAILTERGEVAVESLRPGDRVVTVSGSLPVIWIGECRVDIARHPDPDSVRPIRVRRDAFASGQPARDLLLSPDHAIAVDGGLIPAKLLVNDGSIAEEPSVPMARYFHVELEHHAILFSNGLPTESYLDTGNRRIFMELHPRFAMPAAADGIRAAPLWMEEALVEPVWHRLAARSRAQGLPTRDLGGTVGRRTLSVTVNGWVVTPVKEGLFGLPEGAASVRLVSSATCPSALRPWAEDRRRLGVCVSRIGLHDGEAWRDVPLDNPALTDGWWTPERAGSRLWRWTNGNAVLPLPPGTRMLAIRAA